jgi:hypothetical protein
MPTPSYVLTLELRFNTDNPASVLDALCHSATSLYNCALGECLKRLHSYERDPSYHKLVKEYRRARKTGQALEAFRDCFKEIAKKHGYTRSQMEQFLTAVRKSHFPNFGSAECQALVKRAFAAVENVHYGRADKVKFRRMEYGTSFEGKSNGSKLRYDRELSCIRYG